MMYIPVKVNKSGKKAPCKRGWQSNWTVIPKFDTKNQTNIAKINGDWFCIDVDHPEMFVNFSELLEKMKLVCPVIKTSRGYHFYFKNSDLNKLFITKDRHIIFLPWGELRTNMVFQVLPNCLFGVSLPNEKIYTPINFSTIEEMSNLIQELPLDLIEELFHISIHGRMSLQELNERSKPLPKPLHQQEAHFLDGVSLEDCLPVKDRTNHTCLFKLARYILRNGLSDQRDEILQSWLSQNEFLRAGQNYEQEFSNTWNYMDLSKVMPKWKDMFNLHYTNSKGKSKQKKVNDAVEGCFRTLGSIGQFAFGTKFMESAGIHHQEISRAIQRLLRTNKAIRVKDAYRWRKDKKNMKCAEYKLIK